MLLAERGKVTLDSHVTAIPRIKLVVSIVPRKKGNLLIRDCEKNCGGSKIIIRGEGTASSEVLELLGLGETEKDVVLMFVDAGLAHETLDFINRRMNLEEIGEGIAFTVNINGIGGLRTLRLLSGIKVNLKAGEKIPVPFIWSEEDMEMDKSNQDLIITIIERGFATDVMDAAKEAGAIGGTILHGRGAGIHETERFLGVTIQPEKDLVLNLVPRSIRAEVIRAICEKAGLKQPGKGICFSVPVSEVAGMSHKW